MDDSSVIYGLEDYQARSLAPVRGEQEKILFLLGTQSLRIVNQVQLIEFDDDTNLMSKHCFDHPAGEIWLISSAPTNPKLFSTVYREDDGTKSSFKGSIWKYDLQVPVGASDTKRELELVCHLNQDESSSSPESVGTSDNIVDVIWAPETEGKLVALKENELCLFDLLNTDGAKVSLNIKMNSRSNEKLGKGCWYPHMQASSVAATFSSGVTCWDLRTSDASWSITNAHVPLVRNLDFNPNKQYYIATCGDDCRTLFWDIRKLSEPVKTLNDHSHWVWSVRFNPSYDHLVLTCSSDHRVLLTNMSSIASQPFGTLLDDDGVCISDETYSSCGIMEDGIVQVYEDHEDSVYAVEWSTADFWTFASLSYDGRLVIHKVPRKIKYKQFI